MISNFPLTQAELETYLWGAATLLRGTIDAGDYKQFIFPLLFWKRTCDVYNEETVRAQAWGSEIFPEDHRFQIPGGAHWKEVRAVSTNVGMAIQEAMRAIEKANQEMLSGIFGDAPWTNKERLSDATLRNLIEHFSGQTLSTARVSDDLLGQAYEYLIKKFADDSGHTAAEFYTNRTVVRLMTLMLEPQPSESVYDPTCGSGGMLLTAALELKRQGQEYRTLKLYGQEINLMTSAMARMNLFLHGIEDFRIERGDTLSNPRFLVRDRLQRFDVVLANPPYSIKQWNRSEWEKDPYGRNRYGTPPQGRADYAFFQHIIASLHPKTGRCAILFPHGVLFRDEERHMREKMVQADLIECVVGLGPNLFYNSPMEACVVICRMNKPAERRGKILLINAVNEVTRERAFSFLEDEHTQKIASAYHAFADVDGFAQVVSLKDVLENHANLNISLYIRPQNGNNGGEKTLEAVIGEWQQSSQDLRRSMDALFSELESSDIKRPMIQLEPGVLLSSMKGLAEQVHDFSQLFQPTQQTVGKVLGIYSSQMRDLFMISSPVTGIVGALNAELPKIDMSGLVDLGGIGKLVPTSLADAIGATIDTSAFAATLPTLAFPEGIMFGGIAETTALLNSEMFKNVQDSLGLGVQFESGISNFLNGIVLNNPIEFKSIIGNSKEVDVVIEVLSDEISFEELPENLKANFLEISAYAYEHGITAAALVLWVVSLLWLLQEKSFGAASNLTTALLMLLLVLKERADKDRK